MKLSRYARVAALAGYLALLSWLLLWLGYLAPSAMFGQWLTGLACLPLLLPLSGLLRGRSYTYAWASLLALVYLTFTLTEALVDPGERRYAYTAVAADLIFFVGCLFYVRWRAREAVVAASR